jgi:hypothetical protein
MHKREGENSSVSPSSIPSLTFSIFSATNIFAFSAMTPAASAAYVCAYDDGVIMM